MNSVIKRLKTQSMDSVAEGLGGSHWEVDVDKFFELVIKECVSVMENEDSFYGEWMGNVIKEHFGIKSFEVGDKVLVVPFNETATVTQQDGYKIYLCYDESMVPGIMYCYDLEKIEGDL